MLAITFPGQGSQAKGMGKELFDKYPDLVAKADKILGYSIKELCLDDPENKLGNTLYTQPALYTVNALSYLDEVEKRGQEPDYLAGHSLGEFNALLAAGCFDFEAGLKLVKKRGELMSQVKDGAMAAIVNSNKEQIEQVLLDNNLNNIDLANYNSPTQIVISGAEDEIAAAKSIFSFDRVLFYPLNTSGAFHSRFMKEAQDKFRAYAKRFKYADPKIPVISNVTAKPYGKDELLTNLPNQIASTVLWSDSVQYLLSIDKDIEFQEAGHGNVLTKLVAGIKRHISKAEAAKKKKKTTELGDKTSEKANDKVSETKAAAVKTEVKSNDTNPVAQKVKAWNEKHPIGTKVTSSMSGYEQLETRTEAVVLFAHRAAVYMKGYNGYFDLDELQAV